MLESLGEIPWQICSDIIIIIIQILNREWHEFTNWSHIYMMMHHVELSQFTLHQISLLSWQWRYGIYDYVLLPFHLMVDMFYFTHSDKFFSSCILICTFLSERLLDGNFMPFHQQVKTLKWQMLMFKKTSYSMWPIHLMLWTSAGTYVTVGKSFMPIMSISN